MAVTEAPLTTAALVMMGAVVEEGGAGNAVAFAEGSGGE